MRQWPVGQRPPNPPRPLRFGFHMSFAVGLYSDCSYSVRRGSVFVSVASCAWWLSEGFSIYLIEVGAKLISSLYDIWVSLAACKTFLPMWQSFAHKFVNFQKKNHNTQISDHLCFYVRAWDPKSRRDLFYQPMPASVVSEGCDYCYCRDLHCHRDHFNHCPGLKQLGKAGWAMGDVTNCASGE